MSDMNIPQGHIIYGHDTISMLWGNMVYCEQSEIRAILLPSLTSSEDNRISGSRS